MCVCRKERFLIKQHTYEGLNFVTLRMALLALYWWKPGMTDDAWAKDNAKYVIPMQHNWANPIDGAEAHDTFIQYWIDRDERLTQDYNDGVFEKTLKVASITVRFLGEQAEQWARALHHLTKRNSAPEIFADFCNGETLEYVGPIVPINVDYFRGGNAIIAYDISLSIKYVERLDLSDLRKPLEYISIVPGEIISGLVPQEV
jgi:hypothetical protein